MSYDKYKWSTPEKTPETYVEQHGRVTCDGTGTTSPFTFATQNLKDMANANYLVWLTAQGTITEPLSVTGKATTGFNIVHEDALDVDVDVLVMGKPSLP